jgi:hypothetical protein
MKELQEEDVLVYEMWRSRIKKRTLVLQGSGVVAGDYLLAPFSECTILFLSTEILQVSSCLKLPCTFVTGKVRKQKVLPVG